MSSPDISTCSHERCAVYFMESIRSTLGFYGWQCQSYFNYIFGLCPYAADDMTMAGEDCQHSSRGMNLVKTNSVFPFARGRFDEDISRARSVELNINDDYQAVMNYLSAKGFTKDANETAYRDMLKALGFRNQIIPKVLIIKENWNRFVITLCKFLLILTNKATNFVISDSSTPWKVTRKDS